MKLEVGQELAKFEYPPISKEQLADYAQASGDNNPIHLDESFAKQKGLPGIIAHGMLSMAFMGDYVRQYYPEGQFRLVRLKTRFRRMALLGDVLSIHGKVKSVDGNEFEVALSLRNQKDEVTSDGVAQLASQ